MPYDPTLPINNSPITSAELRNQFAGLKTLIDGRAGKPPPVFSPLNLTVSDPPAADEVQAIADKVDELIAVLKL